jgi:hypothetical protein
MIRLDIDYVRNRTLRLDLDIIFRTIPALFTQMNDARKRRKSFASTAQTPAVVPAQSSKQHPEAKPGLTAVIDTRRDA